MIQRYFMPTKVISGENCIVQNSEQFKTLGKKALIVTGERSAKMNGSENDVKAALDKVGIPYIIYDKVKSNPTVDCVYEGSDIAKENKVDFIIAIGGGSPMDAGKVIALLSAQDIDKENLFSGKYDTQIMPLVLIPTTAGTGSEVTQYSILTNDAAQTKTSIATDLLFPAIAFLDARYTESLSLETTINTAIDALSHSIEGMLSIKSSYVSNALAKESIRMIVDCFANFSKGLILENKTVIDIQLREKLLAASFIAGMVIAQTGTTAGHAMGYSLTYFKDIDHGRANGLILIEYLKMVQNKNKDVISEILSAAKLTHLLELKKILEALLGEKEILSLKEIQMFSKLAIQTKNITNGIVLMEENDLVEIYSKSFRTL